MINRQKSFLILSLTVVLGICLLMVMPYLGYILTGTILAFMLKPVEVKLSNYIKHSSTATVLLTVLMALLPVMILLGVVTDDAAQIVNSIDQQNLSLGFIEERISAFTGQEINIEERIKSSIETIGSTILSSTSQIVDLASGFSIGISILLFTQYYALKQGEEIVEWTKKLDVIPDDIQEALYSKTANTTHTVIEGHVVTAMASGLVAGIGFLLTGVPNVAFWTFMMMILGLIPLIGTALIWAPAAIYLLISGQTVAGAVLLIYGVAVVGSVDNFLRPFLVDEDADLHPIFIIFGVIGGIGVFGPIGIFVGPVMFGIAKSLIKVYMDNYDQL